jgi:hypothetical protein
MCPPSARGRRGAPQPHGVGLLSVTVGFSTSTGRPASARRSTGGVRLRGGRHHHGVAGAGELRVGMARNARRPLLRQRAARSGAVVGRGCPHLAPRRQLAGMSRAGAPVPATPTHDWTGRSHRVMRGGSARRNRGSGPPRAAAAPGRGPWPASPTSASSGTRSGTPVQRLQRLGVEPPPLQADGFRPPDAPDCRHERVGAVRGMREPPR